MASALTTKPSCPPESPRTQPFLCDTVRAAPCWVTLLSTGVFRVYWSLQEQTLWYREGFMGTKSTGCSSKEPAESQQPRGSPQPPVAPGPEDPDPSASTGLCGHKARTQHRTCSQNTHAQNFIKAEHTVSNSPGWGHTRHHGLGHSAVTLQGVGWGGWLLAHSQTAMRGSQGQTVLPLIPELRM